MNPHLVPNTLTIDQLAAFGHGSLHQIARNCVGSIATMKLILGRCLIAVARTDAHLEFGCSGPVHYACSALGLEAWRVRQYMRVARDLEELPRLRLAAEQGEVPWSKLREVTRVAEAEDEDFWLEVRRRYPYDDVERLVGRARAGYRVDASPDAEEAEVTQLRLNLSADSMRVIERAVQIMCEEVGKALPPAEALVYVCADLVNRYPAPLEQRVEEAHAEARKDRQAEVDNLDALECSVRNIPTWSLANACREEPCPHNPEIQLVRPDRPHWENDRLQYNPDSRLATPAQKAALLRRDGYRCKTPGCPNHLFLEAHHITFYSEDGKTVPDNLVVLCSACHKNIHEGHLRIEGRAPHALKFLDASGRDLAWQHSVWLARWLDCFIGWSGTEDNSHLTRAQNT